jgi:ATP-dependent DNA helicase RecG
MKEEELQLILEEGEGYKIEFKESTSNIDKEFVAFANSSGGRVFLGIDDDKEIKGVEITNRLKSQIQDIANNCQPPIKILFEAFKSILIITVREGEDKPYQCASGFYTRIGPNSQKLTRDEIVEFFREEGKIRFDELINLKFDYEIHFNPQKLDKFLRRAGISKVLDDATVLVNLGVAEKQEGKVIFNNTGILFFAKNLQDIYFHTTVTCALYKGIEKVEVLDRRDFNEDIVSSIDGAVNFLKQWIPVRDEPTGAPQMKKVPEIPYDALREAIINAVTHRNYFERGANVMVEMFDDRIEITNPGGLVKGLQPEDFGKRSVLRNPNIANLLHRIQYIEKMGTGISKIRTLMAEAGLSPVQFEFDTFFTATFRRKVTEKPTGIAELFGEQFGVKFGEQFGVKGARLERVVKILETLHKGESLAAVQISKMFHVSTRTIEKDIKLLRENELITFMGAPKTGRYELTTRGKKVIRDLAS